MAQVKAMTVLSRRIPSKRKRKKRKKRKLLRAPRPRCGRPRAVQRQVPAVQVVHVLGGAPVPVHRQCGGHSCFACRDVYPQCKLCRRPSRSCRCCSWTVPPPGIGGVGFGSSPFLDTKHTIYELCLPSERFGMSMDLADPVSSGKYSGTFVFTAPVAEPTVMSFTVPLNGYTIVATAAVVTLYSSSAYCPDSAAPMCCGGVCVAMSCGGECFSPDGAYDSVWDSVRPLTGKFFIKYFQYQEFVGCVCMLNYWFSSIDDICPDNYNYSGAEGKLLLQFLPVPRGRWVRLHAHCRFSSIDVFAPTTTTTSSSS